MIGQCCLRSILVTQHNVRRLDVELCPADSGATLMMGLEYQLVWFVLSLDMLSVMSDRDAIKAALKQSSALQHLSFALRTLPINDETQDILGTSQALLSAQTCILT